MKSYKIHLIRNALTAGNLEGKYIGTTDESLCGRGIAELHALKDDYGYPPADYIFTSPYQRCRQTAEILYPNFPTAVIRELGECDFGEFEGKTPEELTGNPAYKAWLQGNADAAPPGGESNRSFASRVCGSFIKIADGMIASGIQNAAIVTHGGAIMAILSAFGIPQLPMSEWLAPCGCGYTVLITPGVWASHRKIEVYCDIPEKPMSREEEAQLWDWYPEENAENPFLTDNLEDDEVLL